MNLEDFRSLCRMRRSIRYFDDKQVTKDDLTELLDVAHLAPSIENLQPWKFHVITNEDLRKKLMQTSCYGNFITGASAFVIVTSKKMNQAEVSQVIWNPRELEYSSMAAMTYLLLGATAKGIGSCWVSLHHGEAHALLQLPMNEIVVGGIMLGYIRKDEQTADTHPQREPLSSFVSFHE
jgi:nitroreductase